MTFIRFKVLCNHSASEQVEMDLVEDDMSWTFECPKCGRQVDVTNWTTDKEGEENEKTVVSNSSTEEKKP